MIEKVETGGLSCWCDGYRAGNELAFLSLFGPQNAVRAVWASLVGRRHGYLEIAGRYVRVEEGTTYVTMQRALKGPEPEQPRPAAATKKPSKTDMIHLVFLHPDATNRISGMDNKFIVVGHEPEKNWRTRFGRLCRVPTKTEWIDELWRRGTAGEQPLITPLDGFGMPAYSVNCKTEPWHEIVKGIVEESRCIRTPKTLNGTEEV